jgi:hypothetical protein
MDLCALLHPVIVRKLTLFALVAGGGAISAPIKKYLFDFLGLCQVVYEGTKINPTFRYPDSLRYCECTQIFTGSAPSPDHVATTQSDHTSAWNAE